MYRVVPEVYGTQAESDARYIALFGTRTRFVVMTLVLLCLTSIWSNILTFNFAVICMGNASSAADSYSFTKAEQSWATSVVAIAALLANVPAVMTINRVGIRTIFTALGIISAAGTLLLPTAVKWGFPYVLACRALQGLGFAGNFPVIGAFCSKWTYFKQTGLFVSVLVAYVQLAPAITMPVSGMLCEQYNWMSVFYAHGTMSLMLFLLYGLFYRNSPQKHPFVGQVERGKISIGKTVIDKKASKAIPYAAILRTPAVWAVWAGAVGNFTAVNLLFLYSPLYLSQVLGMEAHHTGFVAAFPPLAQFIMKLACGAISDRIKCISEVNKFRIFNSIAFFGSATFFLILAGMSAETRHINMILLGGAAGILGATTGGFFKAGPVLSKQYSHFVTGNISIVLTLTMLVVPFIVSGLTKHNTHEEWRWVFVITAGVQIVMNIIFCVLIRGEPCVWTKEEWHRPRSVADLNSLANGAPLATVYHPTVSPPVTVSVPVGLPPTADADAEPTNRF